jgi:hypothetical protein
MHIIKYIFNGANIKGFSTKREAKAFKAFLNESENKGFIDKISTKMLRI